MTDPRQDVLDLTDRAGRFAEQSQACEAAGKYEEAFAAMEAAQALDQEARSVAVTSGDEWLMSLWEKP